MYKLSELGNEVTKDVTEEATKLEAIKLEAIKAASVRHALLLQPASRAESFLPTGRAGAQQLANL